MSLAETLKDAEKALQLLGENVDDEFLFLLPSLDEKDDGRYRMEAFINCFPSGFNTRSKLNMLLAESKPFSPPPLPHFLFPIFHFPFSIFHFPSPAPLLLTTQAVHAPVPHYSAKLEKSMDRFFASLPIGKIVKRANWSISTNGDLFCLKGNHMTEEELGLVEGKGEEEEVDLKKTVLRCERQTLHRLPRTGGLVFAFVSIAFLLLVNGSLHMEGGHADNSMCRKRICILYKSYAMRGAARYWLKLSMG
jgi:hypothetical protein